MNILHTIAIKIGHVVAAVLVFVGLQTAPVQPQNTVVDIEPITGQITVTAGTTSTPEAVPVYTVKQIQKSPDSGTSTPVAEPLPAEALFPAPQPVEVPIYIIQQPVAAAPTPQPQPVEPAPIASAPTPISMKSIEIISPMVNKGLGRTYTANPDASDDSNYIELGLVVRDDEGKAVDNVTVTVEATDASQNKTMIATGNVRKIYVDGNPQTVPYYPFSYNFKTTGDHTIIFRAEGLTEQVTVTVQ